MALGVWEGASLCDVAGSERLFLEDFLEVELLGCWPHSERALMRLFSCIDSSGLAAPLLRPWKFVSLNKLCACVTLSSCSASAELKCRSSAAAGAGGRLLRQALVACACERLSLLLQPRHGPRLRSTSPPSPQHLLFAMYSSSRTTTLCFFAVAAADTSRSHSACGKLAASILPPYPANLGHRPRQAPAPC